MPRGHVPARRIDVVRRVVEEDVGAERFQQRALVAPTEEQRLVQAHLPYAQCADHPVVRGRGSAIFWHLARPGFTPPH